MEKILLKLIFFACFLSVQGGDDTKAEILQYNNKQDEGGNYKFSFKTSNGIDRSEVGTIKNDDGANEFYVVKGSYSYTAPDGTLITVYYVADENGYRVSDRPPTSIIQRPVIETFVPPAVVSSLLG